MARFSLFGCLVVIFAFTLFAQQTPAVERPVSQIPIVQQSAAQQPDVENRAGQKAEDKESPLPPDLALQRVAPPSENATPKELEDQADGFRSQKLYLDSIDY